MQSSNVLVIKLVTTTLENNAKRLQDSKFSTVYNHLYYYEHDSGVVSTIDLSNHTCTCRENTDKGLCLHLIRVSIIESHKLPGMTSLDKFSKRQMRRKKKKTMIMKIVVVVLVTSKTLQVNLKKNHKKILLTI